MKREDLLKKWDCKYNKDGSMSRVPVGQMPAESSGNRDSILAKNGCKLNADGSMSKVPAMSAESSSGQPALEGAQPKPKKNGAGSTV